MAKKDSQATTAGKPAKQKWYRALFEAFQFTRKNDKQALPLILGAMAVVILIGVGIGLAVGSTVSLVYGIIMGTLMSTVAGMGVLTWRTEKTAYGLLEGRPGGSLQAVQTIRRGWTFRDEPIAIDPKGGTMVFQGVGKAGIALIGEGNNARRQLDMVRTRVAKITPGVPIHEYTVSSGAETDTTVRNLPRALRKLKGALSRSEQEAVRNRLRALPINRMPIPKGIDPMKTRPSRRAR